MMIKLNGRWSRKHELCVRCGSKDCPHEALGECKNCYNKRRILPNSALRRVQRYSWAFRIKNIDETHLLKECNVCKTVDDLLVHHKDLNRKNNHINNFVTMCRSCHSCLHMLIRLKRKFNGFEHLIVD